MVLRVFQRSPFGVLNIVTHAQEMFQKQQEYSVPDKEGGGRERIAGQNPKTFSYMYLTHRTDRKLLMIS